jgi:hypothetical protein
MRQALDDALRLSPVQSTDVVYPTGSIVVCYSCGKPLYTLQGNIYLGEKPSRSAWKYAPITVDTLRALMDRTDLDAGLRASIKLMSVDEQRMHCEKVPSLKAGDWLDCPACQKPFVFVRTSQNADGAAEFIDRAYVIQLATIPPVGKARRLTRVDA